ncbi:MAG: DUF302 domain-containing protein [Cyanobacteria bacterium J06581_3]
MIRRTSDRALFLLQVLGLGGALLTLGIAIVVGIRSSRDNLPKGDRLDGLVIKESAYSVEETEQRLVTLLEEKDINVFATIDHEQNAKTVDLDLRPTKVVLFGNPMLGTPLMQCEQSIAIDLPQKMLIWEDEAGEVSLAYTDPSYLSRRHELEGCGEEALETIAGALNNFSEGALSGP